MNDNDRDERPEDQRPDEAEQSRETGGDAPAAGSIAERESVAADEDDLFEGTDDRT